MNGIAEAAVELQSWLQSNRRQFCVIGGLAVIRWGEHRLRQLCNLADDSGPVERLVQMIDESA